jgi:hypothetical protein
METLKRKIDAKRRGLEELILKVTVSRKEMQDTAQLSAAVHLEKALEFLAAANHNLWMSTIALGNAK